MDKNISNMKTGKSDTENILLLAAKTVDTDDSEINSSPSPTNSLQTQYNIKDIKKSKSRLSKKYESCLELYEAKKAMLVLPDNININDHITTKTLKDYTESAPKLIKKLESDLKHCRRNIKYIKRLSYPDHSNVRLFRMLLSQPIRHDFPLIYSDEVKEFSKELYKISPKAYNFVRKSLFYNLPYPGFLKKHVIDINTTEL